MSDNPDMFEAMLLGFLWTIIRKVLKIPEPVVSKFKARPR